MCVCVYIHTFRHDRGVQFYVAMLFLLFSTILNTADYFFAHRTATHVPFIALDRSEQGAKQAGLRQYTKYKLSHTYLIYCPLDEIQK